MAPVALLIGGRKRTRGAMPYVRPGADAHPATRPPVPERSLSSVAGTACPSRPATNPVLVDAARGVAGPHWNHRKATA